MSSPTPLRPSLAPYERYALPQVLRRTASRLPDKVAVVDGERHFTFKQLEDYSDRFGAALAGIGVGKGDRVAVLAPNCAEFMIAFYGIVKAGAVVTTVNSGYREREIAHQLNDAGAEVVIAHADLTSMMESARDAVPGLSRVIPISPTADDPQSFWGLIQDASSTPPAVPVNPEEDVAVLPYSSGTTGLSKGVMLTHLNLTSNLEQVINRVGEGSATREDEVMLVHLPLFHIYGMNVLMNPAIAVGATQVMMGRFDMEEFLGLLSRNRVSQLFTVPPVGLGLTQYPGVSDHDLSALRVGFIGAAPLSTDLQQRLQDTLGFPIIQGYGMTEASPVTNADFMEPERARPGSIGPAVSDTEEKVVDIETGAKELPPGEIGELLVRGPQVMKGYYENAQATAETLTEDGWLHTGDIVRMDPDGYFWVLDRKKELIKYKGFQVPPAELEGVMLEHPAVADAAVIGKPDLESGEVPKAFVVWKQGAEPVPEELMQFVAGKVATFKQVREVEFVDTIPKNPSGKILRRVLIEQEREKAAAR